MLCLHFTTTSGENLIWGDLSYLHASIFEQNEGPVTDGTIWIPVMPIRFRVSSVIIFLFRRSSLHGIIIRKSVLILGVYSQRTFISGHDAPSTASDNCEIPFSQIGKVFRRHLVGIASAVVGVR